MQPLPPLRALVLLCSCYGGASSTLASQVVDLRATIPPPLTIALMAAVALVVLGGAWYHRRRASSKQLGGSVLLVRIACAIGVGAVIALATLHTALPGRASPQPPEPPPPPPSPPLPALPEVLGKPSSVGGATDRMVLAPNATGQVVLTTNATRVAWGQRSWSSHPPTGLVARSTHAEAGSGGSFRRGLHHNDRPCAEMPAVCSGACLPFYYCAFPHMQDAAAVKPDPLPSQGGP